MLQKSDGWLVEQEQLRTKHEEKSSQYSGVLSLVHWLDHASTSSKNSLKEWESNLHLFYNNIWEFPVLAGASSQVTKHNARVRELKSKVAGMKIKRVAAVTVANARK